MRILMVEPLAFDSWSQVGAHHYARCFVDDGHQVFWLGPSHHALSLAKGLLGSKIHKDLAKNWMHGPKAELKNLVSYMPVTWLPFRNRAFLKHDVVLRASLSACIPSLKRLLQQYDFASPDVLWLSQSPDSVSILRHVRPKHTVYRMSDMYSGFSDIAQAVLKAEAELINTADLILVTSQSIVESLDEAAKKKAKVLRNGVDLHFFDQENHALSEPKDLARLTKPRAIFVGTLGHWVDMDLLKCVADELAHVQFVLIGPVSHQSRQTLVECNNVALLGPKRYEKLPAYLKACDMGLIPFKKNALCEAADPVKLYEYCAAGLPVVATRLRAIAETNSPARLASTKQEFVQAIRETLENKRYRKDLTQFAQANTWKRRYEQVLKPAFMSFHGNGLVS